jgi:hypothetical protein
MKICCSSRISEASAVFLVPTFPIADKTSHLLSKFYQVHQYNHNRKFLCVMDMNAKTDKIVSTSAPKLPEANRHVP